MICFESHKVLGGRKSKDYYSYFIDYKRETLRTPDLSAS